MVAKAMIVMRHGEAEMTARSDAERRLTAEGRLQAESVGRSINQVVTPEVIFASPYVRAQETAHIVAQTFGSTISIETLPIITPDSDVGRVARWCDSLDSIALIVTHMPLIAYLLQGFARVSASVGTGCAFGLKPCEDGQSVQAPVWRLAFTARPHCEVEVVEAVE